MGGIRHQAGSRQDIRLFVMDLLMKQFDLRQIWLLDSLQVFDPYLISRKDTARARQMMRSVLISRPFTVYQLRDKLFTLQKMSLGHDPLLIISSIDCFDHNIREEKEKKAIKDIIDKTIEDAADRLCMDVIICNGAGDVVYGGIFR